MVTPSSSSEYCCPDITTTHHMGSHHLQDFGQNTEMYSCDAEMIGFDNKNHQVQHQQNETGSSLVWKSFFNKQENNIYHEDHHHHHHVGPSSSNKALNHHHHEPSSTHEDNHFYNNHSMMVAEDDPSSLRSVFSSIQGNERINNNQGLALSLHASNNPSSTMGLQSFDFMRHDDMRFVGSSSSSSIRLVNSPSGGGGDGFIFSNKNSSFNNNVQSQQHSMMQDGFLGKSAALDYYHVSGEQLQIRNSNYLVAVQELLNEFCNLGTEQTDLTSKIKKNNNNSVDLQDDNSKKQSPLFSLDLLELQRRKAKLVQMLEEVDRRYKHYCDQMKSVTAPFETVSGHNAAKVYSVLASKAMSRHFRSLRDGILEQIKIAKKAMGEKDSIAPGTTRGETPRLRILDQNLRQQRAFQQMSIMESHPWRPQRGLPERSVSVLRAWLFEHFLHPYPSDVDKHILSRQTGLSRSQVSNWFINARVRLWKPMVEEMYLEELKEQENHNLRDSMDGQTAPDLHLDDENGNTQNHHHHNQLVNTEDHKPTPDQLVRIDAEYLSSIMNTSVDKNKNDGNNKNGRSILEQESHHHHQQLHKNFNSGAMEFDFSTYNHQNHNPANEIHFGDNNNENGQQNYGGGKGNGISLTLGLQQHGGSGVSLAFSSSSASHQTSLFYPRDHIEDCQQLPHYSLLDNHQTQNLPYRNLMGAQLLHDFAG